MSEPIPIATLEEEQPGRGAPAARPCRSVPIALIAVVLAAIVVAGLIYQPWMDTPFDILDFSEFLPHLRGSDSFAQRLSGFTQYYASQGRFNVVSYAFLIWKWSLFGWNEAAWQIARSVQMLCIAVGVYLLLRRLGGERWGSVAGASLFVVAQAASPAWIRLTMGEPLGLLAIVGASLIAVRYQESRRWATAGAMIALLLAVSLMAKEMLAAFVPFVLLLACCRRGDGQWERLRLTRRNVWLATLVAGGAMMVLVPVAIIALRAGRDVYVSDYGTGSLSLTRFLHNLAVILLPVGVWRSHHASVVTISANLVFLAVALVGLWLTGTNPYLRRRSKPLVAGAGVLVIVGGLIYLPWPYFQDFYGLPFLLGPAILLAIAISSIERERPRWRWLAYAGCVVMLAQASLYAAHESRAAIALRKLNRALISDLAAHPTADSVVVAVRFLAPQRWQGTGPTLGRYARSVLPDQHIPPLSDALCSATLPMFRQGTGSAMLISYSTQCGTFPRPTRAFRYYYTYLDWPALLPRSDSLVISILGPTKPR